MSSKESFCSWANQCLGSAKIWHDKNRRTNKFSSVGQNYASKYHTSRLGSKFLSSMIMDFYDEVHRQTTK